MNTGDRRKKRTSATTRSRTARGAVAEVCFLRLSPTALLLVLVGISVSACGYASGGTWADDPGNFTRAWGVEKPDDVEVVRSWYWRSAHFTREEAYFFHLRAGDEFASRFAAANGLVAGESVTGAQIAGLSWSFDRPDWFAPERDRTYESWRETPGDDRRVFRDPATGDVFVYACQL